MATPPPIAAAPPPPAPLAGDTGLTVGVRLGYAAPFGDAKTTALSDVVDRSLLLGADVGWFFGRHLYAGASFAYGFAHNATGAASTCPSTPDVACTASELRFGLAAHWHFLPTRRLDPWVGLGVGYDVVNLRSSDGSGELVSSASLHGFDFLDLSAGLDAKPAAWLGIGPYLGASLGHYASDTSPGSTTHGFITVGLRVRSGT